MLCEAIASKYLQKFTHCHLQPGTDGNEMVLRLAMSALVASEPAGLARYKVLALVLLVLPISANVNSLKVIAYKEKGKMNESNMIFPSE